MGQPSSSNAAPRPIIYYSYDDQDEAFCDDLKKHLPRYFDHRDRRNIEPGTNPQDQTQHDIEAAHVILLLVSADYLNSSHYNATIHRIMERHRQNQARVIPIYVRPATTEDTPFQDLQALPRQGPALASRSRDEVLEAVAQEILRTIRRTPSHILHQPFVPYFPPHPTPLTRIWVSIGLLVGLLLVGAFATVWLLASGAPSVHTPGAQSTVTQAGVLAIETLLQRFCKAITDGDYQQAYNLMSPSQRTMWKSTMELENWSTCFPPPTHAITLSSPRLAYCHIQMSASNGSSPFRLLTLTYTDPEGWLISDYRSG
jgi:hypothetical protein